MFQVKIFEGASESKINAWLKENTKIEIINVTTNPMYDLYQDRKPTVCNCWINTIITYKIGGMNMKYKLVQEDVCNAYILDIRNNEIVTLYHTKRPDLGFKELQTLLDKANGGVPLKPTIEDEFHWVTIKCPNCEEKLGISKMEKDDLFEELRFYKYCYNCGVKLDWEG